MSDLLKTQRQFALHIGQKNQRKILAEISGSKLEAQARLNIYRNNVYGGFFEVLSENFPVTKKILGEKKFTQLLQKYCQKFPSKSGDLNQFGNNFPKFLTSCKPLFLKDLAQLELQLHLAYFKQRNLEKFNVKKFQKLSAENFANLVFTLDPTCFLFSSKFAIFSIWQKKRPPKNLAKGEFVLVRCGQVLKLDESEFLFLSLIAKGQKLYQIYQTLCRKNNREIDIGKLVNHFISNGTIINYA